MLNVEDIRLTPEEAKVALDKLFPNKNTRATPGNIALFGLECANTATDKAIKKSVEVVDDLLDSMGLGIDNFPLSAWNRWQALKKLVERKGP